jgi:hypothetical protein
MSTTTSIAKTPVRNMALLKKFPWLVGIPLEEGPMASLLPDKIPEERGSELIKGLKASFYFL